MYGYWIAGRIYRLWVLFHLDGDVQCRQFAFALQEAWSIDYVAGGCVPVWNVRISVHARKGRFLMGRPKGSRNTTSISKPKASSVSKTSSKSKASKVVKSPPSFTTMGVKPERIEEFKDEIEKETGVRPVGAESVDVAQRILLDRIDESESRPLPSKGMYAGEAKPQDHLDAINHTLSKPLRGRPWAYPSPEALRSEILEYFEFMVGRRIPLTVAGLCAWLGISTTTASYWKKNERLLPLYTEFDTALAYIQSMQEAGAVEGRVVPYTYQFLAKNYHGMRDIREIEVTGESGILDASDQKAIIENIPDVAEDD